MQFNNRKNDLKAYHSRRNGELYFNHIELNG